MHSKPINHQAVDRARLLFLAAGLLLGCVPTAKALRSPTRLLSLTNNGTLAMFFNAENQLTNITFDSTWKTEFVCDGLGRRRIERDYGWQGGWVETNETRYVYDGYSAIQERDSSNVARVTYTRGVDLSASLAGAGG